jgi:ubiquinone/menaquinone biosynthesis C-methylase UbiE
MFEVARKTHPEFKFFAGDMADLSQFDDNSFDAVISLFSSFSHCMNPAAVLSEIQRVARPAARVLITAYNGRSLDRIVARDTSDYDSIRMDVEDELSAPTRLYTRKNYHRLFVDAGFRDVEVTGLAVFANLMEFAPLWPIDRMLSIIFPGLCDTMLVHAACP